MTFAQCWCYHNSTKQHEVSIANSKESMNLVFANQSKEDAIYPHTTQEIAEAQQQESDFKTQAEEEGYSTQLVENIKVLCKQGKMVKPKSRQHRAVAWFHHYLQHPGTKHLKKTLHLLMYWKGLRMTVNHMLESVTVAKGIKQTTQV